jgi:signal transduction histidine kinase
MRAPPLNSLRLTLARIDEGVRARAARIPGPRQTIRLRLTVTYGLVFLITGGVLLTIGYLLVRSDVGGHHIFRRLGIQPPLRPFPNSTVIRDVQRQIQADTLHRLLVEYLFALGVMTMIAVGTGWLLAGRALRPLREITSTARRVSSENLGERIGLSGPADELKELADTFDSMLERLDAAFASQRHFVANASHELRTPLAIMRTEVDVSLADSAASRHELRTMGEAVREMIDRCEQLIESLLMLARSEAAAGHAEPVDLSALAADCITDLRARADDAEVRVATALEPTWARGEPALLERMIANLIDNGIQHNEPSGVLEIATSSENGHARLTVLNGGALIDPLVAQRLTDPFTRLDREHPGFGLGLSIVRSVVDAHGGQLQLRARDRGGLEVRVSLPLAPAPPAPNVFVSRTGNALTQS